MKLKKLVSLLLACFMLLPIVAYGENSKDVPTLTVGIRENLLVEDYETNDYTLWIEDTLGCNLEFYLFSPNGEDYVKELNLMISAGEKLPDILIGFEALGKTAIDELGAEGYFVDLTDYFNDKSTTFWEMFSYASEGVQSEFWRQGKSSIDGKMYSLHNVGDSPIDETLFGYFLWNTKWLEAVGEDAPTNIDELYTVLTKFKNEDPNGNGIADELPLVGYSSGGYRTDIVGYIMQAFVRLEEGGGADPWWFFNIDENGKLWVPHITDEYRQGLIYCNKLYKEGLLSEMVYNITGDCHAELKKVITPAEGPSLAGNMVSAPVLTMDSSTEAYKEFSTGFVPLADATGKGHWTPIYVTGFNWLNMITTDCKDVDLALKVFDLMYSKEAHARTRYGTEGKSWIRGEGLNMSGNEAFIAEVTNPSTYGEQSNETWHRVDVQCVFYGGPIIFNGTYADAIEEAYFTPVTGTVAVNRDPVTAAFGYINCTHTPEEKEELAILAEAATYVKSARALFITGELDPNSDEDWQTYLETAEGKGLSRYTEICQQAYDREH